MWPGSFGGSRPTPAEHSRVISKVSGHVLKSFLFENMSAMTGTLFLGEIAFVAEILKFPRNHFAETWVGGRNRALRGPPTRGRQTSSRGALEGFLLKYMIFKHVLAMKEILALENVSSQRGSEVSPEPFR